MDSQSMSAPRINTTAMMLKLREKDIARTCCDYLRLDGWRILNCEPVSRLEWGKGFGEKGMADTLAIRYWCDSEILRRVGLRNELDRVRTEVLWIEWKRSTGRAAPHQKTWHEAERARGALTLIAGEDFEASIEGFVSWYRASGLNRGKV